MKYYKHGIAAKRPAFIIWPAAIEEQCIPSAFAKFMERNDINLSLGYMGKTITKHIMEKYESLKKNIGRRKSVVYGAGWCFTPLRIPTTYN